MMEGTQLLAFAGVVQLAVMSPGPDFAIMIRNSAVSGRKVGMMTAFGISAGILVWAVSAAAGIAALLAASATAYTFVKLAGAAYLVFLGARAVWAAMRGRYSARSEDSGDERGPWTGFRQGLLCNVLNPKAAVFYMALMPQFMPASPGVADTMLLAGIAAGLTGVWYVMVANVVGALKQVFNRPAIRRRMDATMGTLLVGLGLKIAVDH